MHEAFHRDGFVVLRGAVSSDLVARARRLIDDDLAADESIGRHPAYAASSFCPTLRESAELLAAFDPLAPTVAALLGVQVPVHEAQIALVFPACRTAASSPTFHLDGFPAAHNRVPTMNIQRHTLLAGVFLSPVRHNDAGGLAVWPGSHRRLAAKIAEIDPERFLSDRSPAALLAEIQSMAVGPATVLHVESGDAVLVHHLLAHAPTTNLSVRTRYALYARLQHPAHDPRDVASLVDTSRWFVDS